MSTKPFRVPFTPSNPADPDRRHKGKPNLPPAQLSIRVTSPSIATQVNQQKTIGVWIPQMDKFKALKILKTHAVVPYLGKAAVRILENKPSIQLFLAGKSNAVENAQLALETAGLVLYRFDVSSGAGQVRPPNIYRDPNVRVKG